jgi:hypothetical protein
METAQFIQIVSDIETSVDISLNYESNDQISLTVANRSGLSDGRNWTDWVILDGEPVYPPLSEPDASHGPSDHTAIFLGGFVLFAVLVLAVFVRGFIRNDYDCTKRRHTGSGHRAPNLAPNPDEIPEEEGDDGVEDAVDGVKTAVEEAPGSPYEDSGTELVADVL